MRWTQHEILHLIHDMRSVNNIYSTNKLFHVRTTTSFEFEIVESLNRSLIIKLPYLRV